jgi:hypothetical protein
MANPKHLDILKQGVKAWNQWRREHPEVQPDLNNATLNNANFNNANFSHVNLNNANLIYANLIRADFSYAKLISANLIGANLNNATLNNADFIHANLSKANLNKADLIHANLNRALLSGADFTSVNLAFTTFADNDLSEVKGLETINHFRPSSIGVDTLYKSAGRIPEAFLRGCGVPDDFITYLPSVIGAREAVQFYSCFISYSTRDEEFARRLYSRMRDEELRVWFAPEELKGGMKLYEQIERAIQLHDRLLLVLSESSMQSKWVINEIQRARETELKEGRRKLFPIAIVEFEKVKAWRRFDADTGEDLAKEVRDYFIPDFSNWKDYDAFEKAFKNLLRDLRAEEAKP